MTTTDCGRSPDGSGYSAGPEPISVVSAVPVSIPNADELVDAVALAINACFNGLEIRDEGGLPLYQGEAEALARAAIMAIYNAGAL